MTRTPPSPALKVKTLKQQNTDFTAEGSPPPATASTVIKLKPTPPSPDKSNAMNRAGLGNTRSRPGVPQASAPKLPHERDESIDTVGTIASEQMKRAERDIKHGLKDTDRGAEADRTYKKLKQTH
jgi:hypothetical protein